MSNNNIDTEELVKKLPGLINTANDKLTIILGNAEIAMLDLVDDEYALLKKQLEVITALSEEIGVINGKIMGLIAEQNYVPEAEA